MTVCLVIITIVLAHVGGSQGPQDKPWVAWFVLVFICIYIAAYAWSCESASAAQCLLALQGLHDCLKPSQGLC